MKKIVRIFWITGLLILFAAYSEGQYLQVSRAANVKESYDSGSPTLEKAAKGDFLLMLEAASNETNSYYKVRCNTRDEEGWIYRTLVRRYDEAPVKNKELSHKDLIINIVDVGVGSCNVITLPDGRYIIYDAGNNLKSGNTTLEMIEKIIPEDSEIELMILSHTDFDHIGAAGNIIENYRVKKIVNTGYEKSVVFKGEKMSPSYAHFMTAIANATYAIDTINLYNRKTNISPGTTEKFGDVTLTYLCGFGVLPADWESLEQNEKLNAVSIVAKIEYHGTSLLLSGDAVGRHIGNPENTLIATEKYMVEEAPELLHAEILVAPHHGADNGSTPEFIKNVSPEVVIFSAGHKFQHPRQITADRYTNYAKNAVFFRTDRGDDEGVKEWDYLRITDRTDEYGDDDVQVVISSDGKYKVKYLMPEAGADE